VFAAAAVVLITIAGAAQAQSAAPDARSCAVRYRAVELMFGMDTRPKGVATTQAAGARAKAALVRAGLMKASASFLPTDVSDAGAAYYQGIMQGTVMSTDFLKDVRACDAAAGQPALM
jgi:hypothetical protein